MVTRGTPLKSIPGEVCFTSRVSAESQFSRWGGDDIGCSGVGLALNLTAFMTAKRSPAALRALPPGRGCLWACPVGVAPLNLFTPENARRRRVGRGLYALYARRSSGAAAASHALGLPYLKEGSAASTGP